MLLAHALWDRTGRLAIWAEDANECDRCWATPAVRRGAKASSHPWAASPERLATDLGLDATAVRMSACTLWLPSTASRPQPSPQLVLTDRSSVRAPDRLAAWEVPHLSLSADTAVPLLMHAHDRTGDAVLGTGWTELREVVLLGLQLVAAGRVLPDIVACGPHLEARWVPVPTAVQRNDLARLALVLSPLLTAETPSGCSPIEIVTDLLGATCDTVMRDGLKSQPASEEVLTNWLAALAGPDRLVHGPGSPEIESLVTLTQQWHKDACLADRTARTCFRLVAPEVAEASDTVSTSDTTGADEARWVIDFQLQSVDDPSLLVPATAVWAQDDLGVLSPDDDPEELLLADLGLAARLYAPLGAALDSPEPVSFTTDAAGAVDFLRTGVPDLERNGFGVLIPGWWQSPQRLGLRLRSRTKKVTSPRDEANSGEGRGWLGADSVATFDWQLSLGDDPLTAEELAELARLKQPLVKVRGQWTWLSEETLESALAFLENGPAEGGPEPLTVLDSLRMVAELDVPDAGSSLPVLGIDAEGPLRQILEGAPVELLPVDVPPSFCGQLRPYQQLGLAWMAFLGDLGLGACLADDMGLGKTVQLLALLAAERSRGETRGHSRPSLLVCPTSVLGNWAKEAERFVPELRVYLHHGSSRLTGDDFRDVAYGADLVLTSYQLCMRDEASLALVQWQRVVLDEAQNIKNASTRQARAIRQLAGSSAVQRIALTGTPIENRLGDLWSLMAFLNPGLLGSAKKFRETFVVPVERYGDEEVLGRLTALVRPFLLRRTKTDPLIAPELPPKIERSETCLLTREQASLYKSAVDDMVTRLDGVAGSGEVSCQDGDEATQRRGIVLSTLLRLKQVCNHPALLLGDGSALPGRSGKLDRLEELVAAILDDGSSALIFTQFARWAKRLRDHLQEVTAREVLFLHGGTSRKLRDELVDRFQSGTGPPLFVMSLKAGGVGLNLTAATHVIHYDRWWNPAVENQATDRAYRIGQTRGVEVHKFVCAGTIEERIEALMADKARLAELVVGSGEAWLTRLSTDELVEVVSLSRDTWAVA